MKMLANDLDSGERLMPKANNDAPNAAVANQKVRAPPDDGEGQPQFGAQAQQLREVLLARRLGEEIRLATHPQRGAPGQRLLRAHRGCRGNRRAQFLQHGRARAVIRRATV
jgi:hypothetical protein